MKGYIATVDIQNAHPKIPNYPILEGDLLIPEEDGTWTKECPGLTVGLFVFTPEQVATFKEVEYEHEGLVYNYRVITGSVT